jgi:hypothetical protein
VKLFNRQPEVEMKKDELQPPASVFSSLILLEKLYKTKSIIMYRMWNVSTLEN